MDRAERQRLDLEARAHGLKVRAHDLDLQGHTLEVRKHNEGLELKRQELAIRRDELANQRKVRYTSLSVAVIAAAAAIAGAIGGAIIQGDKNSEIERQRHDSAHGLEDFRVHAAADIEKNKFESALILKAGESTDPLAVVSRLRLWVNIGFLRKDLLRDLEIALNQDPTLLLSPSTLRPPAATSTAPSNPPPTTTSRPKPTTEIAETSAMRSYRERIASNPNDTDSWIYLGYALMLQGKTKDAVESLERAVQINSRSEWGYYNLALAYFSDGKVNQGEKALDKLLSINPAFASTVRKHKQFDQYASSSAKLNDLLK